MASVCWLLLLRLLTKHLLTKDLLTKHLRLLMKHLQLLTRHMLPKIPPASRASSQCAMAPIW
jgi:hypothetical protein